jgi:hypothetical protein
LGQTEKLRLVGKGKEVFVADQTVGRPPGQTAYGGSGETGHTKASPWASGLILLAGVLLIVTGIFQFLEGLVAIANKSFYVVGPDYTYRFNVTAWGWIHLILGVVVVLVGIGLLTGNRVARIAGIVMAAISALVNFMWIPHYPIWSLTIIAFDLAVIWALTRGDAALEY